MSYLSGLEKKIKEDIQEDVPAEGKICCEWFLSEKYIKTNEELYWNELISKNICNFKIDKEYSTSMAHILSKCVGSEDLMNQLIKYFYKNSESCRNTMEKLIQEEKMRFIEKIKHMRSDSNLLNDIELNSVNKNIEKIETFYSFYDNIFNFPIDFKKFHSHQFLCNFLTLSVIEFFVSFAKKNSKEYNKVFKETFDIINKYYSNKNNKGKKRIDERMKSLIKDLHLNKFEQTYLLLLLLLNVEFYPIFTLKQNKNLVKLGLINEFGERNHININIIKKYFFSSKGRISDFIIKSESLKLDNNIKIEDYPSDMQDKIKNVEKLLRNHKGKKPLNILFWGEPGSGKSTLVYLLQKNIPKKKFVKIDNELLSKNNNIKNKNEEEPHSLLETKATMRVNELKMCSCVAINDKFVFIMDESDDILNGMFGKNESFFTSKKEINELLESLDIPVIWIINHKENIDFSTLRRFQYSIKFDKLNNFQREKIWKKQIEFTKTSSLMKNIDIKNLSSKYNISPGVISIVLSNLKDINPKKEDVEQTLENLIENYLNLIEEYEIKDEKAANNDKYDIKGLNIKSQFSIDKIVPAIRKFNNDLKNNKTKNKNLCLLFNGPPGTGKTEFVKYIARELNKELHYIVYGDVASCWVGETETMIRQSFKRAEKENAILFFDEADSLISNRGNASHSWEITQTSEILTRMERFKGIFIASTNFIQSVDTAAMRRFQFKIEFNYLDNEGKEIFFERFFDKKIKDKNSLFNIQNLTPGDFKAVRDRLKFLDDNPDEKTIIYELNHEVEYKNKNKIIGFK